MRNPAIDMTGETYGKWTVLHRAPAKQQHGHAMWLCVCACGAEKSVRGGSLRRGASTRCRSCARLDRDR